MTTKATARPEPERCKECGLCVFHCPKKAIAFAQATNSRGCHFVVVDDEKCVGCGFCYVTCPDGVMEIRLDGREAR